MKTKLVLMCLMLLILTGCNAKYTLTINDDKSSKEKLIIADYEKYYDDSLIPEIINDTFNYSKDVSYYSNKYLTIERNMKEYVNLYNNSQIKKYFGNVNISENKISFEPDYDKCIFLFSDGGDYDENGKKIVSNDKIEINLTIPFKIKTSNADKINNNTYTWTYDIKQCNKELYIEFYKSKVSTYILLFIGLIIVTICVIVIKRRKLEQF